MAENKFNTNKDTILSSVKTMKNIQIGIVISIDDPNNLGRIKVSIPGPTSSGGDDGLELENLPWCLPMVPKFFSSIPKVGEGVFIVILDDQKTHSDRLYFGPIISSLNKLNLDPVSSTALNPFTFAFLNPNVNFNQVPALTGIFPKAEDISIQGRYNTDIILKKNEILIRAGKFENSTPNENNPYPFKFNNTNQAFIQIKNDIKINVPKENETQEFGTVTNIVANKINLLTHKNGTPRFNLMNQDNMISDSEILSILENAHPLPFGDLLVEYLKLLKNALLNHVHSSNGTPATDLVTGGNTQDVLKFKKLAEDLENRMLSKNIRIN
jgi:hypothetical protein